MLLMLDNNRLILRAIKNWPCHGICNRAAPAVASKKHDVGITRSWSRLQRSICSGLRYRRLDRLDKSHTFIRYSFSYHSSFHTRQDIPFLAVAARGGTSDNSALNPIETPNDKGTNKTTLTYRRFSRLEVPSENTNREWSNVKKHALLTIYPSY